MFEVALGHCLWDPDFGDRAVERFAAWLEDKPKLRNRMKELLKKERPSRGGLPRIEYAATLARYNHLVRSGQKDAAEHLATILNTSKKNIEGRLTKARKMLEAGELSEWEKVLR